MIMGMMRVKRMGDEVEEDIPQQSADGKRHQHLEQWLINHLFDLSSSSTSDLHLLEHGDEEQHGNGREGDEPGGQERHCPLVKLGILRKLVSLIGERPDLNLRLRSLIISAMGMSMTMRVTMSLSVLKLSLILSLSLSVSVPVSVSMSMRMRVSMRMRMSMFLVIILLIFLTMAVAVSMAVAVAVGLTKSQSSQATKENQRTQEKQQSLRRSHSSKRNPFPMKVKKGRKQGSCRSFSSTITSHTNPSLP